MAKAKNPKLNFLSGAFDPLLALNTPELQPPIERVAPRDNITRCLDLLPENDPNYRKNSNVINTEPRPLCIKLFYVHVLSLAKAALAKVENDRLKMEAKVKTNELIAKFAEKFVSGSDLQSLTLTETKLNSEKEKKPDVSSEIETALPVISTNSEVNSKGPYSLLIQLIAAKNRVTVTIRKSRGIRGKITGYLKAFDKHWNLIMSDVEERFTREEHSNDGIISVEHERFMHQLFIRGDCIVSISS